MINEKSFIGAPLNFKGICRIYPPKVKDIIENDYFSIYKKIFIISQEEIEDEYAEKDKDFKDLLNPFEYILNNAYNDKGFEFVLREAFKFFIHEEVNFIYEKKIVIIGDLKESLKNIQSIEELRMLREEDYFDFQNMIRASLGEKQISPYNPNEHPKIKRMKAKARLRDRIKAKQGNGLTLVSTLCSICCMNFGINPLNIGELTYAALHPLIRFYQEKEKYELDVNSLLAGADSKKIKPKYWVKNIED